MSIIVCNCQHCDEQQFQILSCVHYTIFSVVKLDLFIRALLLDRILALEKQRVRLVYILSTYCAHAEPIFKNLNVLTIDKLVIHRMSIMMYKFNNGLLPTVLNSLYKKIKFTHMTLEQKICSAFLLEFKLSLL